MLNGREHFYAEWLSLVRQAVRVPPVLDLGTPAPFYKEMAAVRDFCPAPYFCVDVGASEALDAVCRGERLPFRDRSLGGVLCSHVLEHVAEPQRVIDEIQRTLRSGGMAYFTFLDYWPYHARPGFYQDFHRFKRDAIGLMLRRWKSYQVLRGGGLLYALSAHLPSRLNAAVQPVVNALDQRVTTHSAAVYYVTATR